MAKWSNSGFRPDLTRPARENNGSVFGKGGREVEPEKGDPTLDDVFFNESKMVSPQNFLT